LIVTLFLSLFLFLVIVIILAGTIKKNNQWEEAILLRLGRYNRSIGPGLFFKIPFIEQVFRRDMRIRTLDIRKQEVITKDHIFCKTVFANYVKKCSW